MKYVIRIFIFIIVLLLLAIGLFFWRANDRFQIVLSDEIPPIEQQRETRVLSAFFGLDNALPLAAIGLSWKAPGKDGMPIVFSHEIDPESLDANDFMITTAQGNIHEVDVVTLRPAIEAFELKTVLLIGDFGDHPDDEPIEVSIVGDLLSRSGNNFKGEKVKITPLVEGPFLSYADYFELDTKYPIVEEGRGCDCPRDKTIIVVRTVWAGGVRALSGEELGANELQNFDVYLQVEGDTIVAHPFKLADLRDNDNNIDLCIDEEGIPLKVSVKVNTAIDPRGDANDFTSMEVISRW